MKRLLLCVAGYVVLTACVQEQAPPVGPTANIDAGKGISNNECAGCHGSDGTGAAPGIPHLAGQPEAYLLGSLQAYKVGTRTHAALRDLTSQMTETDLLDVAGFYASLPPVTIDNDQHASMTSYEQGAEIAEVCVSCHGETGNSVISGIPSIAGQQPLYFIAATQA